MSNFMTFDQINSAFTALNLPLIERGMHEVLVAKGKLGAPQEQENRDNVIHRVVLSNGTGKSHIDHNAKLERRTY